MKFREWYRARHRKNADFNKFVLGMAQMVAATRAMQPGWQRIEIIKTADGIKWGVEPDLPQPS